MRRQSALKYWGITSHQSQAIGDRGSMCHEDCAAHKAHEKVINRKRLVTEKKGVVMIYGSQQICGDKRWLL